ncbi:MAG TPA: hypothetical protein DEB52_16900 [Hyphomonas sp.]|jgi:hypothetical protein|nr:hypothetical protein [Hyphomonas sp.]HBT37614.1 hypothetical protein [Hyphomonas sp.]|tara:strand:+ start:11007 stop:11696 length:690 start_codon:yes stop_codon:yes gene_type:complete
MILPAIKSAILRVTGVVVQEVFTSTDMIAVEMADLVNDVAADIALSHDWRALTKVHQVVGDGSFAYPLPSDYDRMVLASDVDDAASWFWGYHPFDTVNEWMRFKAGAYSIVSPGGWIIIGDEFQFYPAPNGTAQYPYISNAWARDVNGVPKSTFTADDDTFVLDDRLLTLGLIWRWLDQKDMPYAEAMQTYETALSQAQTRDRGARVIGTASRHRLSNGRHAYNGRAIR